ncbi:MAG: ribosome biogenesis GTPase Der [Rhodospirillaceae bacterium]|nr:ribosome biogenesis GTPase Der [Rhodospirillaceae bacterium]MBT6610402.1 ribosome biogenesis GTPase Der [Rhodospirillaceae bacterium]
MPFTVAIIGRPNVGKSTLFNRLTGRRHAIVDDTPGVTRDRREGNAEIGDLTFRLVDTAGLEDADDEKLEGRMRRQTEQAIDQADAAMFMIDARAGVTPVDEHFAAWLRTRPTPVILLANKCEGNAAEAGRLEAYGMGIGEPIAVSAEHGQGLGELYDALQEVAKAAFADLEVSPFNDADEHDEDDASRPLQLAIVGRPNVGKSTMVNYLLGEDRMLTGPEAGITRDAISIPWQWQGRDIQLVDTAGMRRKARVAEKLEKLSVADSLRAVQYAEVVVLVLDSNAILDKQDLTIARNVIEEGRALIIVVNKWDAADDRKASLQRLSDRLQTSLPQVRGIPILTCSAKTGKGMDKIMPTVFEIYEVWNARIPTAELNRWFMAMLEAHPPPVVSGRRLKLRYVTQAKARPPTFVLFSSRAEKIPESYLRYLANGLRDDFGLSGIPLRLMPKKSDNPYADRAK